MQRFDGGRHRQEPRQDSHAACRGGCPPARPANAFADLLAEALRARDLGAVERAVQLFVGCRIYLPRSVTLARDADTPVALARRLLAAGVGRAAAVAMVAQRRQISERHARRVVTRALADTMGQAVSAGRGKVESST